MLRYLFSIFFIYTAFFFMLELKHIRKTRRDILRNKHMWSRATVQIWVGIQVNWSRSKRQFLLQDPKKTLALMSVSFFFFFFILNSGFSTCLSETQFVNLSLGLGSLLPLCPFILFYLQLISETFISALLGAT